MLISGNIEKLAQFLEGLGSEYFEEKECENLEGKSFLRVYKSVLNSKTSEESLANFARWEPGHGNFSFRYPWRQYLKIGGLSRQCAYSLEVLTNYLITVDRAPNSEFHKNIRPICSEMSSESAKALTDLACSMRDMTSPSAATLHLANALAAPE
ncbi:uncharacterized protein A4U43_C09F1320 [Asparagus officinalis]|uniref:Uncharacterized protein n=2 Tax=Asparagus officinalis TaxID=4686 RepID=A0A5P1E4Q7_ASPOF|nr:uncharacterized protein A4U43_C09F1320 [Asparagus officinalis]